VRCLLRLQDQSQRRPTYLVGDNSWWGPGAFKLYICGVVMVVVVVVVVSEICEDTQAGRMELCTYEECKITALYYTAGNRPVLFVCKEMTLVL
jgi:hypothetical protein